MSGKVCGALICVLALLGGCASPGTPRAPSLNLPEPVGSLYVDRVGDTVRLRWSTSGRTTDGLDVRGAMTAGVCREIAGASPSECLPVLRVPVVAGAAEATDLLPSSLALGPVRAIGYKVRIFNVRGRSAGESTAGFTASGPAPAPIQALRAEGVEEGVLLRWQPYEVADSVEVRRTSLGGDRSAKRSEAGSMRTQAQPSEMLLRGMIDAERAGGMLDRTAQFGETYSYTAQRVRRVSMENKTVEVRSAPSPLVTILLRDVFAPQPPTDLVAIFADGAVDLSWKPNAESDLAGYLVYRREEGQTADSLALNASLQVASAFQDTSVVVGHTYRYTIVAVDRAGNHSEPSGSILETVRVP